MADMMIAMHLASNYPWMPMAYVSNARAFKDAWDHFHQANPNDTFRGFQRTIAKDAPSGEASTVWHLNDNGRLEVVEAWSMMSLETQNALTVDFPIGR
jgi:hypothetical protein